MFLLFPNLEHQHDVKTHYYTILVSASLNTWPRFLSILEHYNQHDIVGSANCSCCDGGMESTHAKESCDFCPENEVSFTT